MADELDPDDDGKPSSLMPPSTVTGLLELMMLHECVTPQDHKRWDKEKSLTAMRYIRQVIENRSKVPKRWGLPKATPGAPETEMEVIKFPGQFGGFAHAPNFTFGYLANVNEIVKYANDARSPYYVRNRLQVRNAIKAATEPFIPANLVVPHLYYWLADTVPGPGGPTHPAAHIQGNIFYTQDNLP